jgi:2-polyprenyl-3-methyl-5-hydroxy-6-metoxy-1,4-benzoquinol methylase
VDYDPFQPGAVLPRRFEAITVMAVLEHYPHSLQHFMRNILSMLDPQGKIYFDVPNIAFWPKRINLLLRGKTPITDFKEIYLSAVPFIGHHHEFTISEMRDLATLSGLTILKEIFYNYSYRLLRLRGWGQPLQLLANWLIKDSRECLALLCQPTAGGT